jgi:hypothetical protein
VARRAAAGKVVFILEVVGWYETGSMRSVGSKDGMLEVGG